MANTRSPQDALEIIELADRHAAAILLDIWHVERTGFPIDDIKGIPVVVIVSTELNDAHPHVGGSLLEDTVSGRLLCKEGSFDIAGFIDAVRSTGYRGPWGVEILSHAQRARPIEEAIRVAYETAHQALRSSKHKGRSQPVLNESTLSQLKPGAIVLKVARGPLIDESACIDERRTGHAAGAGLDVFEVEPLPLDSPLLEMPNVVVTPHWVAATQVTMTRRAKIAASNAARVLAGEAPDYQVLPEHL